MKDIVACVVTYNRKVKLINCLNALFAQSYRDFDILVIDNASTDGTEDELRELIDKEKIRYYNTGSNLGGAGGFYTAIKNTAGEYGYIWVMDDDTYPEERALEGFVRSGDILKGKFAFLSSIVKWRDGTFCKMNCQTLSKNFYKNTYPVENGLLPVVSASFVSLFIKSDAVLKYGLPIKEFFIWGDDTEYTIRLSKDGGYLAINSVVLHDMEENDQIDVTATDYRRITRYRYYLRNRVYIARENNKRLQVIKYHLSCFKQILRVIIYAKDHKLLRIKTIIRGGIESLSFDPKIEYIVKD